MIETEGDSVENPSKARGHRPPQGEPVLDRAFRILFCFGPENRSLSLAALSVRAGLPKPSALRIARKLVEWGALERSDDATYTIGLRLLEVASLAPRGHGLRTTALPYMQDLHHATGQHVLLAVRDGRQAVLVERLSERGAGRVSYRVGGRMPLHTTGVGLVLLANAPAQVQGEILAEEFPATTEIAASSLRSMRSRLAAVRQNGVAVVTRLQPDPMTSVASLVTDHRRTPVAALSVVTRSENVDPAVLIPAVIAVARAISRAVSAAPGGAPSTSA